MTVEYEYPQIKQEDSPVAETVETHPAYAQIGASRVSGGACLYGSDFQHNSSIRITIRGSELMRGLSRDWHAARGEYIEVALSEAQWATFVSTPNIGLGVPCTLQALNGCPVPQIPEAPQRKDQFKQELKRTMERANAKLTEFRKEIANSKLSATAKHDFTRKLDSIAAAIGGSAAFVADQFGEHVETITEEAKIEIHGYMQGVLIRSGIKALSEAEQPLNLLTRETINE